MCAGLGEEEEGKVEDKLERLQGRGMMGVAKTVTLALPCSHPLLPSGLSGFFLMLQGPLRRDGIVNAGRWGANGSAIKSCQAGIGIGGQGDGGCWGAMPGSWVSVGGRQRRGVGGC